MAHGQAAAGSAPSRAPRRSHARSRRPAVGVSRRGGEPAGVSARRFIRREARTSSCCSVSVSSPRASASQLARWERSSVSAWRPASVSDRIEAHRSAWGRARVIIPSSSRPSSPSASNPAARPRTASSCSAAGQPRLRTLRRLRSTPRTDPVRVPLGRHEDSRHGPFDRKDLIFRPCGGISPGVERNSPRRPRRSAG
jgi:hypothetical protein